MNPNIPVNHQGIDNIPLSDSDEILYQQRLIQKLKKVKNV